MKLPVIVVMGVSGSGKTTFGQALSAQFEVPFAEGDDLHSPENIEKMRRGQPLNDADRTPWLDRIAAWIASAAEEGGVISCSALKRVYRDRLRRAGPRVRFVLLMVDEATLERRLAHRCGHFIAPGLLRDQLDTLELPRWEMDVLYVEGTAPLDRNVDAVADWIRGEDSD